MGMPDRMPVNLPFSAFSQGFCQGFTSISPRSRISDSGRRHSRHLCCCFFLEPWLCLSVHVSLYLCVCVSVFSDYTFEPLHIGTSFLGWRYILTISRSSLSTKVIGLRSKSCSKNEHLLISTCYSFICTYRSLIR